MSNQNVELSLDARKRDFSFQTIKQQQSVTKVLGHFAFLGLCYVQVILIVTNVSYNRIKNVDLQSSGTIEKESAKALIK